MSDEFAGMIGGTAALATIAWVVRLFLSHQRSKKILSTQAALQHKLLDKFGSSKELVEFLGSGAGERFLLSAAVESSNPYARILGSIQSGILLTLSGIALLFVSGRIAEAKEEFTALGAIALVLGIGFLVSSAVVYTLSRSWGILPQGPDVAGRSGSSSLA